MQTLKSVGYINREELKNRTRIPVYGEKQCDIPGISQTVPCMESRADNAPASVFGNYIEVVSYHLCLFQSRNTFLQNARLIVSQSESHNPGTGQQRSEPGPEIYTTKHIQAPVLIQLWGDASIYMPALNRLHGMKLIEFFFEILIHTNWDT